MIDFGSAVVADPSRPRPYYNLFFGTTAYASSEILLKKRYQAPPAEVWTLGVLLSYLLTGHSPFPTEEDAKEGKRTRLSDEELMEVALPDTEGDIKAESTEANRRRSARGKGRDTGVKQAKIVRQADRVDSVTGKGRSKGYGFVEMVKHADALRVLRWANNNPSVTALFEDWWKTELEDMIKAERSREKKDDARLKRLKDELENGSPPRGKGTLIVEFSIENVQVVQRRAAQIEKRMVCGSSSAVVSLLITIVIFRPLHHKKNSNLQT